MTRSAGVSAAGARGAAAAAGLVIGEAELFHHGGALDAARRLFPHAPQPWLDLSTGINPVPYPFAAPPAEAWARLPEAEALARLERAAAARYGVPAGLDTVAAPGTQAIICRLPDLVGGGGPGSGGAGGADVRLLGPTYGEFEKAFRDGGARVRTVAVAAELAGADVAVAVNPNNPDGRLHPPPELLRLAARVGTLVVDEAFADALPPAASLVPLLPATRVVVLRSFGKVYGLAGLRLGFAVLPADKGSALRRMLGPWPVSGPALAIGTEALADAAWLAAARDRLRADGAQLGQLLEGVGGRVLGGTPLFRLVEHPVAPALFRELARAGILARPFAARRNWLRFGLPGSADGWRRLEGALAAFR